MRRLRFTFTGSSANTYKSSAAEFLDPTRSIKHECLNRIIPIGEKHLWRAVDAYVKHYNHERPHQGIGNVVLDPSFEAAEPVGKVICDEQLGGLIRSYRRSAA